MSKRTKVLIVEDSPTQAAILAELIDAMGLEPIVYTSLPTGVNQILIKEQPDLVLLDLRLVDDMGRQFADGFQLCREIKRAAPDVPVVILTAEGDDDACQWAFLQGANAYVQKPFVADKFAKVISQVLGADEQ